MNSQELRIGNYVEVEGVIVKVVAICSNIEGILEVKVPQGKTTQVRAGEVKPIVLSANTLKESCYFDDEGKRNLTIDKQRYSLKLADGYILLLNKKNEAMIHFWDVRYLHQLQNLYFALNGKEMPVKIS
jgi:hypothetical protein